jgi:hypothetical protein
VRLSQAEKLAAVTDGERAELAWLLKLVERTLPELSDAITQQYLTHLQSSRHLAASEAPRRTAADSGEHL